MSRKEFLKLGAVWAAATISLLVASCGAGDEGGEDTGGGGGY